MSPQENRYEATGDGLKSLNKVLSQEPADCVCSKPSNEQLKANLNCKEVEKHLKEKEEQLNEIFNKRLKTEINLIKERADFVLQNEQIRASHLLREAHRERQEKILALQTQMACKNLAGLMYVMCSERRKCKLEKLKINEDFTNYIFALKEILTEAQELILNLSRGYKTAARVDHEWRQKMKKMLTEFQAFVHDYAKGTPESDQYFFDVPALLKTESPIVDDPNENPCETDEESKEEEQDEKEKDELGEEQQKRWYERMNDGEGRPFIVFGDMDGFEPSIRRKVLKTQKSAKTAPKKWMEYVFNDMFIQDECSNDNDVKDEYLDRMPDARWEVTAPSTAPADHHQKTSCMSVYASGQNWASRRGTVNSLDVHGNYNMGSILKMIATANVNAQLPQSKANLLGARDSMEIASTTKLREKSKHPKDPSKVVINVGSRRASVFDESSPYIMDEEAGGHEPEQKAGRSNDVDRDEIDNSLSKIGSVHNDSLTVVSPQKSNKDTIHYEKICPMEKCQRMRMNSFISSLPAYMRASPFMHFEKTYDQYEACTPEQLEILKKRIEQKKKQQSELDITKEDLLREWTPVIEGVGTQTSTASLLDLPPCTCPAPSSASTLSEGRVFNMSDLIPVKLALDKIQRECFYDNTIEFNRFKVIGQQSNAKLDREEKHKDKLTEVKKVLKEHPSLLEIFQANTA